MVSFNTPHGVALIDFSRADQDAPMKVGISAKDEYFFGDEFETVAKAAHWSIDVLVSYFDMRAEDARKAVLQGVGDYFLERLGIKI